MSLRAQGSRFNTLIATAKDFLSDLFAEQAAIFSRFISAAFSSAADVGVTA